MPIYEYHCDACGQEFEQRMKFSDPQPTQCPSCSADGKLKRKLPRSGGFDAIGKNRPYGMAPKLDSKGRAW